MRKFALVILDDIDAVIDRYNLDFVTEPQNLGFKLNMSTLTGDIEDMITKVVQSKSVIKFTINQYRNSYKKANSLSLWLQKYSQAEHIMALEYGDGKIVRYCEGRVTNLSKNEIDTYGNLPQSLEFTQTTPFFVKRENTITIQTSATGKSYPFKYPYSYGKNEVLNNNIDNTYIYDIPLIITIYGAINKPKIDLIDSKNQNYNTVEFNGTLYTGERIIINSARKKIYKVFTDGTKEDYRPQVSPEFDTFLMAKNGNSKIAINTNDTADGFKLIGGWREYRL